MTLRSFQPVDACTSEDLIAICDDAGADPSLSYDLAGSREHIEAICRLAVRLAQDLSAAETRAAQWAEHAAARANERDAARRTVSAMERALAASTNDLDSARTEIRALTDTLDHERNERQGEVLAAEADRERADTAESIAEIFEATARSALSILARGTNAKPVDLAEIVRAVDGRIARALQRVTLQLERTAMLVDGQREDHAHNDRLHSAFASAVPAICEGKTIERVNLELDEELAAHPDVVCMTCRDTHTMMLGDRDVMCTRCPTPCEHCRSKPQGAYCTTTPCPCGCHGMEYPHHARDQRDHQEDTTP